MHSLCISFGGFIALETIKWLYLVLGMLVRTGYLFIYTLYIACRIHGLRNCKAALFSVSYVQRIHNLRNCKTALFSVSYADKAGYVFAMTFYIACSIQSLRNCKTALFSVSYVCKERISLCTHFVYHLEVS